MAKGKTQNTVLTLGISQCLLGDPVRYDGGHKRHAYLVDVLGQIVTWVPICPEVEAGLGTPREPMHLVGHPSSPQLITVNSTINHTTRMQRFAKQRMRQLDHLQLDGYVFKKNSPSCGVHHVPIFHQATRSNRRGVGLFAQAFQEHFPLIPIEEEGRLQQVSSRQHFLERILSYHRWQQLLKNRPSREALVTFHRQHQLLLLSHSQSHCHKLNRLVAQAQDLPLAPLLYSYSQAFMDALKVKSTIRKHGKVLDHLATRLTPSLLPAQQKALYRTIKEYREGLIPLRTPRMLIREYGRILNLDDLRDDLYLTPHPHEEILESGSES